jgi:hypothetical protein
MICVYDVFSIYKVLRNATQGKYYDTYLKNNKDNIQILLCRACGEVMIASKYCSDCNEVIQSKWGSCKKENYMSMPSHNQNNNKNLNSFSLRHSVLIVANFALLMNIA